MNVLRILSIGLPLTAAVADVVALVVVLVGAKDRRAALSFSLMTACMVPWNTLLSLESIPGFVPAHTTMIRYLWLSPILLPASVYQTAVAWSGSREIWAKRLLLLGYAIGFLLCWVHAHSPLVDGFIVAPSGAVGHPGPLYSVHVTSSMVWITLGFVVCARTLRRSASPEVRLRTKYWLVGAGVAFPLGLTNFLANYGVPIIPLGSVGNIFLVCIYAYAAVRHRLLDIDVFLMRAAAALLTGVAAVLPVAAALMWMRMVPFDQGTSALLGCLLFAAMVSLLLFSKFQTFLQREVEDSLFPARRAARQAVRRFSEEIIKLRSRDDLGRQLTATLLEAFRLEGAALYVRTSRNGVFKRASCHGMITAPRWLNPGRWAGLLATDGVICIASSSAPATRSGVERLIEDLGWEACVPIRADGTDLGFVALGPKRSRAAIDESDATLLAMVAAQLAIALQNAQYVHEIERQKTAIEELQKRLKAENVALRAEVQSASQFKEIIGSSVALQRVLNLVEQVAPTDATILITGETGTGKELIARAIHDLSPRRNGPLISVNCPAVPAGLAESELFGYERGAFADAVESCPGKFELAHGGTIFLDEVAELPADLQVKLLRVLQEHETQRVGGRKVHKLDLRIVAATNRDLSEELRLQRFRQDLYYRLAAVHVHVPPLRERVEDIPMLASFFLDRAATAHQKPARGFAPHAMAALQRYSWPGNIRELQHVVERAVLLCTSNVIQPEHLSDLAVGAMPKQLLRTALHAEQRRRITDALAQSRGNQAAAARLLGMSRSNLARMMKRLGLKGPPAVQ